MYRSLLHEDSMWGDVLDCGSNSVRKYYSQSSIWSCHRTVLARRCTDMHVALDLYMLGRKLCNSLVIMWLGYN